MAYREYIGSRYVPIFGRKGEESAEWDINKDYEPLTIVLNQGNSYTSRQYVPVGVELTNENYWAETGNFNAQLEQYRRDVQGFNARINKNAEDITELAAKHEEDITELTNNPDARTLDIQIMNGAVHSITVVNDAQGNFIAIDCGGHDDISAIDAYLFSRLGYDKKLKGVIITHFHSDHWAGFEAVAKYCDANTPIWIQMAPTEANDEFADTYVPAYNSVIEIAQRFGLQTPQPPTNLSTVEVGDMTLHFYNTAEAYKEIYDTSWGQDNWANPSVRKSTLNNYSLVVRIEAYGASYLECGDIEGAAQKVLAEYMQPVTIAKHPHHFWNRMGYELFYDRIQPQYWLATDHIRTAADGYLPDSQFDTTYLFRYIYYNQSDINIVTNDNTNVVCKICRDHVVHIDGYFVDKDYSKIFENKTDPTERANQVLLDAIIPPSVYYENPYQARLLTLDDLWTLKTYLRGCPFFEFRVPASMRDMYQIRNDCETIYAPSKNTDGNFYITLREFPTIYVDSTWRSGTHIQLMYNFTMANAPRNMRRFSNGAAPIKIVGTWENGDTISGDDWESISTAHQLTCVLPSGRHVPLVNTRNDVSANTSGAYGDFTGVAIATEGADIYGIKIDLTGLVHTDQIHLADMSVTHPAIHDITAIY